jgi:serine/threonine-protein kinase
VGTSESGTLADYQILDVVGSGATSVVYKAWQHSSSRVVALKKVLLTRDAAPSRVARFQRAAEAAARLRHPNFVEVYDIGEDEGHLFFVLEFVSGGNLAQYLGGRPQPAADAARMMTVLASAVQYAHEQGILHRDLKPANVLRSAAGVLKITDYDLVRELNGAARLTLTGDILGTPCYMAPEQLEGDPAAIGPATDVYALGAILYELLTGRPPFWAATLLQALRQVQDGQLPPPRALNPDLDLDLEAVCLRCLEWAPGARYPSARALAAALEPFLSSDPVERGATLVPRS